MTTRIAAAVAAWAILAVSGGASATGAQQTAEALAPAAAVGKVIPIIVSRSDTAERYALYLPQRYTAARQWPVLLVMDPRGRALVGMTRFQEAAERDGYIVLSSYNTLSDSTEEPNTRAVNAMLADVFAGLAADPKRVYLAGMSGTARMAWGYAYQLGDHVPGILAFAAGLPWRGVNAYLQLKRPSTFVWFGAAGTVDFNYDEVRALDQMVDSSAIPHRVEYFTGAHGWPPTRVCSDALDWMELQAMKSGLRPRDDSLLGAWVTARLLQARAAEDSGNIYEAYVRYRAIRNDFAGLRDVPDVAAKVTALEKAPPVRQWRDREASLAAAFDAYATDAIPAYKTDLDKAKHPPTLNDALSDLKIRTLQQAVRDSARDPLGAQAAERTLALDMANTSFYWPRTYFGKNDPTRALAVLDVARQIDSTDADVCFEQGTAYAMLGRTADAIHALRCAVASGRVTAADLRDEHHFDGIRGDTAFAAIVASVAAAAPATAGQPQSK